MSEDEQRIYDWLMKESCDTIEGLRYYTDSEDSEWASHYARVCETIAEQIKNGEHKK